MYRISSFILAIFVFLFSFSPYVFPESISVSGKIQNISVLEDGRFELQVNTKDGASVFYIDNRSLITESLPANKVKKGQTILLPTKNVVGSKGISGVKGMKGLKGMKSPFGNLSPASAKTLGLPNVPEIPKVPTIPNVPNVPQIPEVPKVPQIPQIPGTGQAQGAKPEPEIPSLPQDPSLSQLNPSPISSATPDDTISPKRVISSKETKQGIQVKLEGKSGQEEMLLTPQDIVFQLLTIQDLKQNMNVNIEADGNNVRQITIV